MCLVGSEAENVRGIEDNGQITEPGNVNCTIVRGGLPDVEEIVESVSVRNVGRLYVNNSSRIVRVQRLKTRAPSGFPV